MTDLVATLGEAVRRFRGPEGDSEAGGVLMVSGVVNVGYV